MSPFPRFFRPASLTAPFLAAVFAGCALLGGAPVKEPAAPPLSTDEDRFLETLVRHLAAEDPIPSRGTPESHTPQMIENLQKQILERGSAAIPILLRPLRYRELPPFGTDPLQRPFPTTGTLQNRCVRTLEKMGEPAVEPLIALAADPACRRPGRQAAISGLGDMILGSGEKPAAPLSREVQGRILEVLLSLLQDQDEQVVSRALSAVGQRASQLAAYALSADEGVRARSAAILANLRSDPVRKRIEGFASHRDAFIRKHAATALGAIGDPASLPILRGREPAERGIREASAKGRVLPVYDQDALDEVQKAIADIRARALRSPDRGGALP
ncbi:MAG: HEAT repeat domain-containing protein [Planctomycetota bacterium]